MHDTGTVFGGDIVTGDNAIGSGAGINPREEGIIFKANEVCAFVTSYDLRVLEIGREAGFREDDMFVFQVAVFIFELDLNVVDLRTDAEGGVGR